MLKAEKVVDIMQIKGSEIFQDKVEDYLRGVEAPFKKTKSAEVYQRNLDGRSYFVKRYCYSRTIKEVLVDIKNNRKKSSVSDYEISKTLKELGIPAIEFEGFYFCKNWKDENAILISPDYREDGWYHPTDESLKKAGITSYGMGRLLVKLMRDFVRLANLNIYMNDIHPENFLFRNGELLYIDINEIKISKKPVKKNLYRALSKLEGKLILYLNCSDDVRRNIFLKLIKNLDFMGMKWDEILREYVGFRDGYHRKKVRRNQKRGLTKDIVCLDWSSHKNI